MRKIISFAALISVLMITSGLWVTVAYPGHASAFEVKEDAGYFVSRYGRISSFEWDRLNRSEVSFETVADFLLEVDYYVQSISRFINRLDWQQAYEAKHGLGYEPIIEFIFVEGASHVLGGYNQFHYLIPEVRLNRMLFEHNYAPIAHEITHIIAPYYSSLSLREGLASLMQDTFGNPSVFNGGEPVIPLSKEFISEEYGPVIKSIGTSGTPRNIAITTNQTIRTAYYLLSYSFTKYVIDKYGIQKFMAVYEADNLYEKYQEEYGMDLELLRKQWIDFVKAY